MKKQDSVAIHSEIPVLKLVPFSPIPKIFFEEVNIGQEAVQFLSIQNPRGQETTVRINVLFIHENHFALE